MSFTLNTAKVANGPRMAVQKVAKTVAAGVVAVGLSAGAANAAAIVKLGGDDGSLAFVPNKITVAAGEAIEFINNAGFPHNIVFDEDEVPAGVDADAISYDEYLNGKGQTVVRKLSTAGTYGVYCEPHAGAGMKMTITVQ
uniref:Plastocyanin n=1 Tax=Ulva pertusa TaxID=3120 RepID=Q6IY75_ULVPE|nr:plastocyanin precursor [Ulva pertusa]